MEINIKDVGVMIRRNIQLDQEEFIDMNSLSRDSAFNVWLWSQKSSNSLFSWLAEK